MCRLSHVHYYSLLAALVSLDVIALAIDGEVGLQALVVDVTVGAGLSEDHLRKTVRVSM